MTTASDLLTSFSHALADAVDAAAPSVVQVHGARRPASGVIYAADAVLTMARALGRAEGVRVRRHDGAVLEAELAGWDPATGLAALRVPGLDGTAAPLAAAPARVGHLALALARSWSNATTASAGIVSVIGGPLPTGRRRSIDQVIRTTAPMHEGFSGGAFVDTAGGLLGVTTMMAIRGTNVVIPAPIAWKTAATLLEHGQVRRGYVGVAIQPVRLPEKQRTGDRDEALLVTGLTAGAPAEAGGVMVGDVLLEVDGHAVQTPEDLLDLLTGERVGKVVTLRILRGGTVVQAPVTIGERPTD